MVGDNRDFKGFVRPGPRDQAEGGPYRLSSRHACRIIRYGRAAGWPSRGPDAVWLPARGIVACCELHNEDAKARNCVENASLSHQMKCPVRVRQARRGRIEGTWRVSEAFDPYRRWLGIPQAEQPPHHYRLLGIGLFEDDPDVIEEAADRQMAHVQTHRTGKYSALSQKLLNELAAAKLCLLNKQSKTAYDLELRSRLSGSIPIPGDSSPSLSIRRAGARVWRHRPAMAIACITIAMLLCIALLLRLRRETPQITAAAPTQRAAPVQRPETKAKPSSDDRPSRPLPKASNDQAGSGENAKNQSNETRTTSSVDSGKTPMGSEDARRASDNKEKPEPAISKSSDPPQGSPANAPLRTASAREATGENALKAKPEPTIPLSREPLPDKSAIEAAANAIQERTQKVSGGATDKLALARQFIAEAQGPELEAASRYALLRQACDWATEAGDYVEAAIAIQRMAERFDISPAVLKADALTRVDQLRERPQQKPAIVDFALDLMAEAAERDDYVSADRAAKLAAAAIRAFKDRDRSEQVRIRTKEAAELSREFERLSDDRARLNSNPDDAQANLAVGYFECLFKQDWPTGLSHLTRCGDLVFQRLAQQDLASPSDAATRLKLGEGWLSRAAESSGDAKIGFQCRAAYWLRLAQNGLDGPERARTDRLLAELYGDPAFANRPRRWLEGRVNGFRRLDEFDCAAGRRSFELPETFDPDGPWKLSLEFKSADAKAAGPLLALGAARPPHAPVSIEIDGGKVIIKLGDGRDASKSYVLSYQMDADPAAAWRHLDVEYLPAHHSIVVELDQRRVAAAISPFAPGVDRPAIMQVGGVAGEARCYPGRVRMVAIVNL